MSNMTKPTGSNPWLLEHSKTLDAKSSTVTITLNTAGTYVDKDIKIIETITAQDATTTLSSVAGSATPVVGMVNADTKAKTGTLTTTKPASGHYVAVNTASGSITNTATLNVSKAGWIPTGTTTQTITSTINSAATAYVPISAGTITTGMTDSGLNNFFEQQASAAGSDITITPNYTATEGYIDASTATNNGGTTYWKIKNGGIVTATAADIAAGGTYADTITNTTAVVPAEGALIIGAGYYPTTRIDLATLIPDDADYTNAADGHILADYEAYDTNGKKLVGTIQTMSLSSDYYTTTIAEGQASSAVPSNQYHSGVAQYIKTGAISASATPSSIKPVITAKTNAITGKTNITATVSTDASKITSPYFITVGTDAKTGTITAHANVTKSGWLAAGDRTATATITASASDVAYANVAAGKVTASGGSVTLSATNTITTAMKTTDSATNAYAINASAVSNASRGAVDLSATTNGYVTGASGELVGLSASGTTTLTTAATTIYIPKATVSISSGSYTAPKVDTTVAGTGIVTSATATDYYITVTNSATDGTVTPSYTASAGYTEGYSTAQTGDALTITPTKTATQTVYIQKGVIGSSVACDDFSNYFTAGTSAAHSVAVTPSGKVTTAGYAGVQTVAGTTQYYSIIPASLTGSNITTTLSESDTSNTITGTNITLYNASDKVAGKEYATISDSATTKVSASGSSSVSVDNAGWVAADASKTISASGNKTCTSSATKYVLVYDGAYNIA